MKAIEIIPLARRKIERRGIPEAWISAMRYEMRTKSLKATAVGRLRNSAAESVAGRSFFGSFSKRLRTNTS